MNEPCLLQHFPPLGQRSWCWKMGKHTLKGNRVSLGQTLRASTPATCDQPHSLQGCHATKQWAIPCSTLGSSSKKWKDIPCFWIGRINVVKMAILPKAVYSFNAISIKIHMIFSIELEQIILRFTWNHRRPQIAKAILRKKEQNRMYHLPRFQNILQNYSNQNSLVLVKKNRHVDQWNRIESRNKLTHV